MGTIYTAQSKNYLQRDGFFLVSNLIIDYKEELGLNEKEIYFLMSIMRNKDGYIIHDSKLDPSASSRTLSRRRAELKSKGFINYSIIKKQDPDTGLFITQGISYDLSPLEEKLQAISDKINERREKEVQKKIESEDLKVVDDIDEPLETYLNDYENYYGVAYNLNDFERKKYKKLSNTNKQLVAYIFKYCEEKQLLGRLVPRLSLFFKVAFRFTDLRNWCIDNGYVVETTTFVSQVDINNNEDEEEKEVDIKALNYLKEFCNSDDTKKFYKEYSMIRRIVDRNRSTKDEIVKDLISRSLRSNK